MPFSITTRTIQALQNLGGAPTELESQLSHIAYEISLFKRAQFGVESQKGQMSLPERTLLRLKQHYAERLLNKRPGEDLTEQKLAAQAKAVQASLRDIRIYKDREHFATELQKKTFVAVANLHVDRPSFVDSLLRTLKDYKDKYEGLKTDFLRSHHDYSEQLKSILKPVGDFDRRIKHPTKILKKLRRRNLSSVKMFYDIVGLRAENRRTQREAAAVVALISGVFKAYGMLEPEEVHFRINHVEVHVSVPDAKPPAQHEDPQSPFAEKTIKTYNNRGYRGFHVHMERRDPDRSVYLPTGEIQCQSEGIILWMDYQRPMVDYGDEDEMESESKKIPKHVADEIREYGRLAAEYVISLENGEPMNEVPEFNIDLLFEIDDSDLRAEKFQRVWDMSKFLHKIERYGLDRVIAEERNKKNKPLKNGRPPLLQQPETKKRELKSHDRHPHPRRSWSSPKSRR